MTFVENEKYEFFNYIWHLPRTRGVNSSVAYNSCLEQKVSIR
jgi:hypothetical protein